MPIVDEVLIKIEADTKGAVEITNALGDISEQSKKLDKDLEKAGANGGKSLKEIEKEANESKLAMTALALSIGVFLKKVVTSGTRLDSLKRGLIAVSGSAQEAEIEMKKLEEVAKLPGLGFEQAVQGSINLQSAGFSAEEARTSLLNFGNAIATVGGGKAELDGVVRALGQIAAKGKVSAEEINQLAERLPQIRVIMEEAFGTANTEEIQKLGIASKDFIKIISEEFGKLPKITSGLQNSIENVEDSVFRASAALGISLAPAIELVSGLITSLADGVRIFAETFPLLSQFVGVFLSISTVVLTLAVGLPLLSTGIFALAGALNIATVGMTAFGAASAIAFAPVTLAILGLAATIVVFKKAYDDNIGVLGPLLRITFGFMTKTIEKFSNFLTDSSASIEAFAKTTKEWFGFMSESVDEETKKAQEATNELVKEGLTKIFVAGVKRATSRASQAFKDFSANTAESLKKTTKFSRLSTKLMAGIFIFFQKASTSSLGNAISGLGVFLGGAVDTAIVFAAKLVNDGIELVNKLINALNKIPNIQIDPIENVDFKLRGAEVANYFAGVGAKVDDFTQKLKDNKKEILENKKAQEELNKTKDKTKPTPPAGGGGKAKKDTTAEDLAEDIEELNDQIKENVDAIQDASGELQDLYEGVSAEIDDIIEKQKDLNQEFEDFTLDTNQTALDDFAERIVEIRDEIKDLNDEESEIKISIKSAEAGTDTSSLTDRIAEIKDELKSLADEQIFIGGLNIGNTDQTGDIQDSEFQDSLTARAKEISDFNALSNAEQIEQTRQRVIDEKNIEIQAEIAKQQELIDIKEQFLAISISAEEETQLKLKQLGENAADGSLGDLIERKRLLEELGFEDITREQELELLKQIQRQQSISLEIDEIRRKEDELLAIREEFLALADEATLESVDVRIDAYDKEIKKISELINQINRLNSLSSRNNSSDGSTSNTDNSTVNNFTINQNISSDVDIAAANKSLISNN